MSFRQLPTRLTQAGRSLGQSSRQTGYRRASAQAGQRASGSSRVMVAVAVGAALPVSSGECSDRTIYDRWEADSKQYYLYSNRVQLEANTPVDSGHTAKPGSGGKGKNQGPMVKIRDVLDKKDSDEIWVVIKGEVYE